MSWAKIILDLTVQGFKYNTEKSSAGFLRYDRGNLSISIANTLQLPDDLKVKLTFWCNSEKVKVFKEEIEISAERLKELKLELVYFAGISTL